MSTNLLVLAFLAFMIPCGSALVCFQCSNVTGEPIKDCGSPASQTCDANQNNCMVAFMKFNTPFPEAAYQMSRNCSVNCNGYCEGINKTSSGQLLECKTHCCTGERCNLNFPVNPTTGTGPTAGPHSSTTATATATTTNTSRPNATTTARPTSTQMDKTTEPSSAVQMYSGVAMLAVVLGNLMDVLI